MSNSRSTLLVIDDETSARFGIRDFLESHGFEVDEAGDHWSAEEAFRERRPDAVILDYLLPDGDTLELLVEFKRISAAVPVLILTAHGTIDLAVNATKLGADQFLTKPIDLPALLVLLRAEIEKCRTRRQPPADPPGASAISIVEDPGPPAGRAGRS